MQTSSRTQLFLAFLTPFALAAAVSGCAEGQTRAADPNTCGDGRKGGEEACDDGSDNGATKDACREDCTLPRCGDGVVDSGEQCDDANEEGGDGCDASCQESYVCGDEVCTEDLGESCSTCGDDCCPCGDGECSLGEICGECPADCCVDCGNGVLDAGEGCDDGNNEDGDGCAKGCSDEDGQPNCGNGFLELGEVCDDGNTVGSDGCGPDCQLEYVCGDQICEKDVGESCITCLMDCCPNCGDGLVNDFEECDGSVPATYPTCQDQCYPGGAPSCTSCLVDYASCSGDLPVCGNGALECGEQCDEDELDGLDCTALGYEGGTLGCSATCERDVAQCGRLLHYYKQSFDAGCVESGWAINFPWQCGAPTGGPGAASSEPNVLTTGLAGNYPPNQTFSVAHATSPVFSLAAAINPAVTFSVWHELGSNDAVQVQASLDGTTFGALSSATPAYGPLGGWTGQSSGWRTYTASLGELAGEDDVQIRFALQSDSFGSEAGIFVDDVLVAETCGNGVVDTGEVCDGEAFGADACPNGTCGLPTCAADCQSFDDSSCLVPDCGNGVRECAEQCDENDVDGETCDTLGHDGGTLDCSAQCEFDLDTCGELLLLLPLEGFEACPPPGWALTGTWQCGAPTSGPGSAFAGNNVAATILAGDYANGLAWETNTVQTPEFTVSGPNPTLGFRAWIQTENSWDGLRLEITTNGGATWATLTDVSPAYTDDSVGGSVAWDADLTAWALYTADLSAYAGQDVSVRFAFYSDTSGVAPGAYIDEVLAVPDPGYLPFDISGPASIGSVATVSGLDLDLGTSPDVTVSWSITDETNGAWISINPSTGRLTGMPVAGDIGDGTVTVRATSQVVPANFVEVTLDFTVVEAIYGEDFDACPAGWTYSAQWECGAPTSGPATAHGGTNCIGTNTYSDSVSWGTANATSPMISLAGTTNPELSFWLYQDVETCCDGSHLEISVGGGAWQLVTTPVPAYSTTVPFADPQPAWSDILAWTLVTVDLSAYQGQSIQLRWAMSSDGSVFAPGPFVDDILITTE